MGMAGEYLSRSQQRLWRRLDHGERLTALSEDELRDWIAALRTLASHADRGPKKAAKARRMWRQRLDAAQAELARRDE